MILNIKIAISFSYNENFFSCLSYLLSKNFYFYKDIKIDSSNIKIKKFFLKLFAIKKK